MAAEEKKTRRVRKKLWKNDPVTITFANKDSICIDTDNDIFITDPKEIEAYLSPREIGNLEMVGSDGNPNDYLSQPYPNLLLKGNNLIALHSLKSRFQNKVKLIYIDPPYNTGKDTFKYNDNFNHSTWLTFMKNRLQIAKELMRDDGVIFISLDDNEQAYLKVLCDEIFTKENFISSIIWLKGNAQNDADTIQGNHEYILCYAKDKSQNPIYKTSYKEKVKVFFDEKAKKYYYEGSGLTTGGAGGTLNARANLGYSIYYNPHTHDFFGLSDYDKELAKISNDEQEVYHTDLSFLEKGYKIIRPPKKGVGLGRWTWALEKFNSEKDLIIIRENSRGFCVSKKEWVDSKKVRKDENGGFYATIDKSSPPKSFIDSVGSGNGTKELKNIFNDKVFDNPKPEKLLQRILEISTKEGDLVLDFFAGSGTTLAVAHKMGRRWIGVEQMDYVESITKERLKKVIEGEQGGMSKTLQWNGGGEFVYAEIIDSAPNTATLQALEDCELEQKEDKIYNNFEDYLKDLENDK